MLTECAIQQDTGSSKSQEKGQLGSVLSIPADSMLAYLPGVFPLAAVTSSGQLAVVKAKEGDWFCGYTPQEQYVDLFARCQQL